MNRSITLLTSIVALFMFSFSAITQKDFDCTEILKREPYVFRTHTNLNPDSLDRDMEIIHTCGQLDSIDQAIFTSELLGMLMVVYYPDIDQNDIHSYQTFLDVIDIFKKTEPNQYTNVRKGTAVRLSIQHLPVNLSELNQIHPKLIETGMTEKEATDFEAFLVSKNRNWTYKEAMTAFIEYEEEKKYPARNETLEFIELFNLESALSLSKTTNKRCLIYFSGYADVNSRKIEDRVLTDPEIKALVEQNFAPFVAYVDDKQKGLNGKTIGDNHAKLQKEHFKSVDQPHFYIVSEDGKILSECQYPQTVAEFLSFLEKGLK